MIPSTAELRVLRALAECGCTKEVASSLGMSRHTVRSHLDRLREKAQVHSSVQLVAWAFRNGWLSLSPTQVDQDHN
ncbi:MAG: helix-turn-helix transcriptional regulator [Armatimonadetes bacterium]|nr:helix-turn-helix transcriptional regulator [Armatimonadota bacterium]